MLSVEFCSTGIPPRPYETTVLSTKSSYRRYYRQYLESNYAVMEQALIGMEISSMLLSVIFKPKTATSTPPLVIHHLKKGFRVKCKVIRASI
jgi:hypothetical protein